jgi:hypothetical protein
VLQLLLQLLFEGGQRRGARPVLYHKLVAAAAADCMKVTFILSCCTSHSSCFHGRAS